MITLFTPLAAIVLGLSWQPDPEATYTVQTSPDLTAWDSLPFVIARATAPQDLLLGSGGPRLFARLRVSPTGDTNANGLPDEWEWKHFGRLDINPDDDPDGDGSSNLDEWRAGTDPLDFYNGRHAILKIACGDEWLVAQGQVSRQALALAVFHADGAPWPEAPVLLTVEDGHPGLLPAGDDPAMAASQLEVIADERGRIHPDVQAIHFLASGTAGNRHKLRIDAAGASASLGMTVVGAAAGEPPRQVRLHALPGGETGISWTGDPGAAQSFVVERQDESGKWIHVAEVAAAALPSPEEDTGRYNLPVPAMP